MFGLDAAFGYPAKKMIEKVNSVGLFVGHLCYGCVIPVFDRVLTLKVSQTAITAACETFSDFTIARYTIMNL